MRILINHSLYGRGGTETHLLHLTRLLRDDGHKVVLATRYAHPSVPLVQQRHELDIQHLSTPFAQNRSHHRLSTLFAFLVWPWYLIFHRCDVILTLQRSRFLQFLQWFLRPSGVLIFIGAGLPTDPNEHVDAHVSALLDGAILETSLQAAAFQRVYTQVPVLGIPLLGNINKVIPRQPTADRPLLRIAYMGRYDRNKGIYRLFDLWPALNNAEVRLDFYGHGEEKAGLERMIADCDYSNIMAVHDGWNTAEELSVLMTQVDLLLLPSEAEGLPVILMEAMAHGVPFVATDVGAVRTYAENNPDVRVVPLDNQAIAEGIRDMVEAIRAGQIDPRRLQQYYLTHYSFDQLAERWLQAVTQSARWIGKPFSEDTH